MRDTGPSRTAPSGSDTRQSQAAQLAVFDIDGTLIEDSSERMFWRFLFGRRRQGLRQLTAFTAHQLRHCMSWGVDAKKNKAYLAGLSSTDIAGLAAEFVSARLTRALFQPAAAKLKWHLDRGDIVVLMSGTLEPIAKSLALELGATHVCATLCAERDGILQPLSPLRHPFHVDKLRHAQELAAEFGLSLSAAYAYGDSVHDLPLLEAVGHPVAVRPDRALRRIAQTRHWPILDGALLPDSSAGELTRQPSSQ